MTTTEFLELICREWDRPPGSVTLDDTDETVEEWDSMGHLDVILIMKARLGVPIDREEWQTFTSIRGLVETLKAEGYLEDGT